MQDKIYILGAGGIALEVYQIYKSLGYAKNIRGFLISSNISMMWPITPKENIDLVPIIKYSENFKIDSDAVLVNGIGRPIRKRWIQELEKKDFKFTTIIHPTVVLGANFKQGEDLVVFPNSTLISNVSVGKHVFISANVYVGHDGIIEDFVTIGPGVNIGGGTTIGNGSFIGIGSTIIQDIKIGSGVLIGAGSVVVKDIPSNTLAFGNPAKPVKKMTDEMWEKFLG